MTDLVVAGGEVLSPSGWSVSDVFIQKGRIVPGHTNVGYDGETVDGAGGINEACRTGGAGAERATLAATVEGDTDSAARGEPLAADGGAVTGRPAPPADVVDARGLRVVPGFVDLQCNGGFGVDLATEPERLWELAAALPATGVTAWLPTIISSPPEIRARALAALRSGPPGGGRAGAAPLGLHLEGPLLSPDRPGAHPAGLLRRPGDDDVDVGAWGRESGVALVTLAPELPGALDVVRRLVDQGVVVSAGHSSATAAEAEAAVDAGVRWVTHLFNAMAPLHHREPGLAGVALADERLRVGAIADGVHLHPTALAAAVRALGDRLTLVTDAVAALGLPPGPVRLGRTEAWADETSVRLADGTLAGSNLSLDRAIRTVAGLGTPSAAPPGPATGGGAPSGALSAEALASAVRAASTAPAAVLGLTDRGVIAPGAVGDLVLLDDVGTVVATVVGGTVAYDRRTA